MSGLTLDAGALISFEKKGRPISALVKRAIALEETLSIPAGALAQAWRGGARHARLAWLLGRDVVEVVALDDFEARGVGQLCGATGAPDVVDASVVLCARRRRQAVVTSDAEDLRRIDPDLELISV